MPSRTKSPDGSGAVRWRAGAWRIQVYAGRRPDGRPRLEHRTVRAPNDAKGRRQAETVARRLYDEAQARQAPPGSLAGLVDAYIDHRADDWAPGEAGRNRRMLERRVLAELGTTPVERLTTADIDALYVRLRRRRLSAESIRRTHGFLRAALEQACRWQLIERNPATHASLPRRRTPPPTTLPTPDQLHAVMEAATLAGMTGFGVLVRLAVHTGARTGELVALRWVDVNHEVIRMYQTKTRTPKVLAVGSATAGVLGRWRERCAALYREIHRRTMPDSWWVFPSPRDPLAAWSTSGVSHAWARLRGPAGLDGVPFKALRKTMSTVLLNAGVDMRTVLGRGGWSTGGAREGAVMLTHYAQFTQPADRAAAVILDEWLDGKDTDG